MSPAAKPNPNPNPPANPNGAAQPPPAPASAVAFVHLHIHSEYSLADGMVRLQPLTETAAQHGLPAIALTDIANVHGAIKFYRACLARGIKPLIGCDLWIQNPLHPDRADRAIILCCNQQGYRNLSKFLSAAYLHPSRTDKIIIAWQDLQAMQQGLLILLDDQEGPLANASPNQSQDPLLDAYQTLFTDRLYLQISRIGNPGEQAYIRRATKIAAARNIGLVATNRVQFIAREEFDAHEIRVCINDGRVLQDHRRPRRFTPQQYLRSAREMHDLFADLPHALANTLQIARRCNLFLDFDQHFLPAYPDARDESMEQILRRQAEQGLCARLGVASLTAKDPAGNPAVPEKYPARLNMELEVINKMGFPGYFLIVADFIRWSKANNIPVGPGRGSGAGSLVAWATNITELDPLHYGLLFERFLNPDRVSLPDFDIDFCVDGRDRVIEYVADRYGRDHVAQIITFGTMAAKAAVRDVGRVMGMPYGFVDQVAKLIPFEIGITLEKALKQEDLLRQRYRDEDDIKQLIDNAMQIEGLARNAGKHAGGVVIAPRALTEFTPLYSDTHFTQAITQLDKDDLETIGLVKFDFLGLRTLTIIELALKMINARREQDKQPPLKIDEVPLDDPTTYEMIRSGRTTAIFQLESRGMKEIIIRLQPDQFDDLVALVALYRPGPLQSGMVDDFINRKHGREEIVYPHPDVAPILQPTYGVILYQEQVMQIAQVLAGYTFGASDELRQAMGKKKPEEMAKQRDTFKQGATERGVKPGIANAIFALMEKFAGYGFNKSHSVAYALIAYHTAWLKAHYPAAFMAATLSAELQNTDKLASLLVDCEEMELQMRSPDINDSGHAFRSIDDKTILYGVGALKGVGKAVSESIAAERARNGNYKDLYDFCARLDARVFNKRVLEALVKSGAMDNLTTDTNGNSTPTTTNPTTAMRALGIKRATLFAEINNAVQAAEQHQTNAQTGQSDMFGEASATNATHPAQAPRQIKGWDEQHLLAAEKEALGLFLSGHPYTRYDAELAQVAQKNLNTLDLTRPRIAAFAGLLTSLRAIKTRRGRMGFAVLDNAIERVEVILYSDQFKQHREMLQKGNILIAQGELSVDGFTGGFQLRADRVADINTFRAKWLRRLHLNLMEEQTTPAAMQTIHRVLTTHRGGEVKVAIRYRRANGESGNLKLSNDWTIHPTQPALDQLADLIGSENLTFHYQIPPPPPARSQYRKNKFRNNNGGTR